jgi:nucleoside-diphosphate-sugar epimerase
VALVTGGVGFIGSRLCSVLADAGYTVHSASRREHPGSARLRHWQIDLSDSTAVRGLIGTVRPDYIFHLASHVMGSPDRAHILPTFHGNLQTTVNLLEAVTEFGCRRFVMAGSFMEPSSQGGDVTPTSPYAAAKWASAAYLRMFQSLYGVPIVTARVFMVYGPEQQDRTKLVPYAVRCLLNGEPPCISSGRRLVDWIYVDDVVEGMMRLAVAEGVEGMTVDLGSGSMIATVDFVDLICKLVDPRLQPLVGALADRPMEPTGAADVARTAALIGWAPRVGLEEGLRRTVESMKSSGAS